MKQCIFCMKNKEDREFNKEHIILEALGGKGNEDLCFNVCTSCNSSLGTRVDAALLNERITKYIRYILGVRGKNGIPNPFKGIELAYADTPIMGEIKVNKEGKISGFRAKHQVLKYGKDILIVGPKKGFPSYVNSQLKQEGFPQLSEKDILEKQIDLGEPKKPNIKYMAFPEEMKEQYLVSIFPTILKIAYEYCFSVLGEEYLNDSLAIEIRKFLMGFDYKKNIEYVTPTAASLEWNDNLQRKISLNINKDNNSVFVKINIWGLVMCTICMSETATRYKSDVNSTLLVEI